MMASRLRSPYTPAERHGTIMAVAGRAPENAYKTFSSRLAEIAFDTCGQVREDYLLRVDFAPAGQVRSPLMAEPKSPPCNRALISHFGDMASAYTYTHFGGSPEWARRARLDRLDRLSRLLDVAFAVPGTNIRFGVEAILRLVPGFGDAAASALSLWLLFEASRLGIPRNLLIRMMTNVIVEGVAGAVPIAGDLFDVGWRANRRNVRLLREHFEREGLF
jgi:hypothetical protein